jgi:hypothetical protein
MLKQIILANKLNRLITLTIDPKTIPYEYLNEYDNRTHEYITKIFNNWMTNIKRQFKVHPKYLWVVEFQHNGNAHLHILTNKFLPINKIRSEWVRLGGGVSLNIQLIRNTNYAANYIIKYLGKSFNSQIIRIGQKRYSVSQNCIRQACQKSKVIDNQYQAIIELGLEKYQTIIPEMSAREPKTFIFNQTKGGET